MLPESFDPVGNAAPGADENLNNDIVRAVRRRPPRIDLVRVQEVGLSSAADDVVLAWTARENRVLLTRRVSLRSGGGRVDATGAWLVGAKGEYPLHRPYLHLPIRLDDVDQLSRPVDRNRPPPP